MAAVTAPTVVLFDLDDTLFAHRLAVADGVTAHRRASGGTLASADDATEIARWNQLEEIHYHRYLSGEVGFRDQRRHRARAFVAPFGIDLETDAAADAWFGAYLIEYERAWTLHDDVFACLDALEKTIPGVRFGIITNAELPFQQSKLDALGLTPRMEHIVASGEVGATKPDPLIFRHAVALYGVPAGEAVYVGDRLQTDAVGAASAGLTGIWLNRRGTVTAEEAAIVAESGVGVIASLAELPSLLG